MTKQCEECGKSFKYGSKGRNSRGRFCGRTCAGRSVGNRPRLGIQSMGYMQTTVNGRTMLEHRRVMEALVGPLALHEVVHHIDRNKLNNDPSNLLLLPDQAYHRWVHSAYSGGSTKREL